MLGRLVIWALILMAPVLARAQGAATLVADQLSLDGARAVLQATGNVQVFYDGTTLSAAAIRYDQTSDRLTISGPIFIRAADGTILTAEQANLDPRLENGVLRSARLVLNQQLQLAANRIDRVDGRYSQLTRTAATSCHICQGRPPIWEIRADRVIHDSLDRQIYFDNATFHIRGVPLLWIPRMRLPDPTLDRATGLLLPSLRSNDTLGLGIKLPYFIRIGDSRDLTLTPFVSTRTNTLEARYRQAFLHGQIEINGAISNDTLRADGPRSYLFAEGTFDLGRDYQLSFDVESASDPAYLLDYGYSDKDRLDSAIELLRVREDDLLQARLSYYETLRDDEVNATLPPVVASLSYERRFDSAGWPGQFHLGASVDGFERTSEDPGALGRDMIRAGAFARWDGQWISGGGLVLDTQAQIATDFYKVAQDPAFADGWRQTLEAAVLLRWPLRRALPNGTIHILEPAISMGWSGARGISVPNEDGTLAELDEGNLFALTRFPGQDSREVGSRTALGLSWTRIGADGVTSVLTFGRLFQDQMQTGFSPASGLSQRNSDWLVSAHVEIPGGLTLDARALFDDRFEFDKTEARLGWSNDRIDLAAAYHWLPRDPTRERLVPASEWSIDAEYKINDTWTLSLEGQYDVASDTPRRAGLGVEWRNECVTVDLSASRRYTSSETVEPSTDYGFSVSLTGFSLGRSAPGPTRACYD